MAPRILPPDDAGIALAVSVLRSGGLVAMPTETVYGLSCDAANGEAVARVFQAKGRPAFNPLIAHASPAMAAAECLLTDEAQELMEAFWPGPLTLVLPVDPGTGTVSSLARAGLRTVAVRWPAHPAAQALIEAFGAPLVAPSANPSGRISPTTAAHVAADMGESVGLILDGGASEVGLESTIISLVGDSPAVLRPGGLDLGLLEEVLRRPVQSRADDGGAPTSPGQLLRHYAPRAQLRLGAERALPGELFLAFGPMEGDANLSPSGSLTEAAANLFAMLRDLDGRGEKIAVAPIPTVGLGVAMNDRLGRAAQGG